MKKTFWFLLLLILIGYVFLLATQKFIGDPEKNLSPDQIIDDKKTLKEQPALNTSFELFPITHATFAFTLGDTLIFTYPVDDPTVLAQFGEPDIVLVSDIYSDHFNVDTLEKVIGPDTVIVVP